MASLSVHAVASTSTTSLPLQGKLPLYPHEKIYRVFERIIAARDLNTADWTVCIHSALEVISSAPASPFYELKASIEEDIHESDPILPRIRAVLNRWIEEICRERAFPIPDSADAYDVMDAILFGYIRNGKYTTVKNLILTLPKGSRALKVAARELLKKECIDEALDLIKMAMDKGLLDGSSLSCCMRLLLEKGRHSDVRQLAMRLPIGDKDATLIYIAFQLAKKGCFEEAEAFTKEISITVDRCLALRKIARIAAEKGKIDKATALASSIEKDSIKSSAFSDLALICISS